MHSKFPPLAPPFPSLPSYNFKVAIISRPLKNVAPLAKSFNGLRAIPVPRGLKGERYHIDTIAN